MSFFLAMSLQAININDYTTLLMPDKGDGADSETGVQEDDFPFQDEMIKSRLCALKRVWLFPAVCFIYL